MLDNYADACARGDECDSSLPRNDGGLLESACSSTSAKRDPPRCSPPYEPQQTHINKSSIVDRGSWFLKMKWSLSISYWISRYFQGMSLCVEYPGIMHPGSAVLYLVLGSVLFCD